MKRNRGNQPITPECSMDSLGASIPAAQRLRFAATSHKRETPRPPIHSDDIAVDKLASAMKAKLAGCRKEGKFGWDSPLQCSQERLATLLGESLVKGNPVNVANFAAFLLAREVPHQAIAMYAMRALLRGSAADQKQRIHDLRTQLQLAVLAMEEALVIIGKLRPGGTGLGTENRLRKAIHSTFTTLAGA